MRHQSIVHFVAPLALLGLTFPAAAQQDLPILRSNSKTISIIDGDHVKSNYWFLMPEKDPDIYHVEIPMKPHTVTFRTDIDERSFDVRYGDRIDFVILLNGQTVCRTQIRAEFRNLTTLTRDESLPPAGDLEIPFTLGDNDKIYIRGRLNDGEELTFQFDLGNGGTIVKRGSVPKANLKFDGTITLRNSDGVAQVPSSSSNHLQIAGLHWRGLRVDVADNMTHREDGLIGNTLFQDKIIEIDYDRDVMVVHDAPPPIDPAASRHAIVLDGVVPFVHGSLTISGVRRDGWFMFDTGAYTSILYTDRWKPWSKLLLELRGIFGADTASSGPRLTLGDHAFSGFNYSVHIDPHPDDHLSILGNDILKRFNVTLDNQNGMIYLRPNSLAGDGFRNPEYVLARVILAAAIFVVLAAGWIIRRRRARSRSAAGSPV